MCLKRLKLSCNVDECKPLTAGFSGAELFNLVNIAAVQAAVQEVGPYGLEFRFVWRVFRV